MLADQNPDSTTIDGGRGGVCNTQRGCGKVTSANKGASALVLPGDLAYSRQMDGTTDNREGQLYGFKTGKTRIPTSTAGGNTEKSRRHGSSHLRLISYKVELINY